MNNPLAYLIGALVIIVSLSLTQAVIQENSSIIENYNITSNNTTLGNASLNQSAAENVNANNNTEIAIPENVKPINNTSYSSINATSRSTDKSEQSNGAIFTIGSGSASNESAHNLDAPALPAKNASNLWYIIQAKPHGYV